MRPRRRMLLGMLVAVFCLGIVGMHELTVHDVGYHHAMVTAPMAGGHDGTDATHARLSPMSEHGHHPGMGDMLMICLAVLTLVAGTLLALGGLLTRLPRSLRDPARSGRRTSGLLRILPNGPPAAWEFSVIRC